MLNEFFDRIINLLGRFSPVVIIPADESGVRLRFGKLKSILQHGPHLCIPWIDRILTCKISEQSLDLPNQTITIGTEHPISITVSGCIRFRICNPDKAILLASDYAELLTRESLCLIAGSVDTGNTLEDVEELVENALIEQSKRWGIEILRFAITDWAIGKVFRLIQ